MTHDLFSSLDSLDSLVSASAADVALMVRDVAGDYRLADADEVLEAAQRLLARRMRGADVLNAPGVVKDFLRARLAQRRHEVFAVIHLDSQLRLLDYVEMFRGTIAQTSVYPREVVTDEHWVVAHWHKGGHVQRAPHICAPGPDAARPTHLVRVVFHLRRFE